MEQRNVYITAENDEIVLKCGICGWRCPMTSGVTLMTVMMNAMTHWTFRERAEMHHHHPQPVEA